MSAREHHQATLAAAKLRRALAKPSGNYDHAEHQWGVIAGIHTDPPSVDLYLDGAQNAGVNYLTPNVLYDASYTPAMGDVVLVRRGTAHSRSDRYVIGKPAGSTSPYPLPLGSINGAGAFISGPSALWGGSGVPPTSLGSGGDYFFRTDTPGTAGQRLYVKTAPSTWTATAL